MKRTILRLETLEGRAVPSTTIPGELVGTLPDQTVTVGPTAPNPLGTDVTQPPATPAPVYWWSPDTPTTNPATQPTPIWF